MSNIIVVSPFPSHKRIKDLHGQVYGRLRVVSYAGIFTENDGRHCSYWNCACDCGSPVRVKAERLFSGGRQSCGCLRTESLRKIATKHGYYKYPEYGIYRGMIRRCFKKDDAAYKYYGGRGVTVFKDWVDSFELWFSYIGPRPSITHSIDRFPNNNGNYEPGNVRWATKHQQSVNRRDTKLYTYNGKTQCVKEWADEYGINYVTLGHRLYRGWDIERAIKTPARLMWKNAPGPFKWKLVKNEDLTEPQ